MNQSRIDARKTDFLTNRIPDKSLNSYERQKETEKDDIIDDSVFVRY